ncbi:MAG: TetR/AcrR family transcriptional regulator [Rhodothermales bacterium]|nr:TetR/AcrR family transcriptional regulator [Rhodothermales bacterium]MBO6780937.1 TetR/AcrR family transcriptional regulator [Rhodothermales bacterium]
MEERKRPLIAGQQRAVDTQRRIVEAATRAFSEHGFESASVRRIAEAAGVRHQVIAYHFGSKMDLFLEVLEEGFNALRFLGGAFVFDDEFDPVEQFTEHLRTLFRFVVDHPQIIRIIHQENLTGADRVAAFLPRLEEFRDFTREYAREVQRHGIAAHVPAENLHMMFLAIVNQLVVSPVLVGISQEDRYAFLDSHAVAVTQLFVGAAQQ